MYQPCSKKHVKDPLQSGKRVYLIPNQPSLTTVFFRLPTEKTSYEKMIEKIKIKRIKNHIKTIQDHKTTKYFYDIFGFFGF